MRIGKRERSRSRERERREGGLLPSWLPHTAPPLWGRSAWPPARRRRRAAPAAGRGSGAGHSPGERGLLPPQQREREGGLPPSQPTTGQAGPGLAWRPSLAAARGARRLRRPGEAGADRGGLRPPQRERREGAAAPSTPAHRGARRPPRPRPRPPASRRRRSAHAGAPEEVGGDGGCRGRIMEEEEREGSWGN